MRHVQDNAEASVRRVIGSLRTAPAPTRSTTARRSASRSPWTATGRGGDRFHRHQPAASRQLQRAQGHRDAVVLYVFRTLVGRDIPLNEGCLKPLRLILPEGSMINPEYPAAVIAGNTEVSQAITDALYGALGVIAGSQGTMNNFIWGNETFQNYETIAGGSGAGPGFDGAPCVQVHMTNTRATDPEVLETRFPVRVERMAHRRAPAAQVHGPAAKGMHRVLRFLEPVTVTTLCSHREVPVPGREGGHPGAIGENRILRAGGTTEHMDGNAQAELASGRRHRHAHPWRRRLGQTHLIPFIFPKIRSGEREGWKTPRRRNTGQTVRHFGFRPRSVARAPCPTRTQRRSHEGLRSGRPTAPGEKGTW
jgi:5-oxoprolinase (ATP-hydrolysing)